MPGKGLKTDTLKHIVTWLMRLLTGGTFIVSGFVKAIDPWGTFYKFEDYMVAMNLPEFHNLLLAGVFILCAAEFLIGINLLLGCFRRSTPIAALAFMAVMLPLTVWIAFWNPVSDCGCFGDAIILSNMATMWKNVVLTLAIIWLLKFNIREACLVRPSLQWLSSLSSVAYIMLISLVGYIYQPLLDFRPYPIGSSLVDTATEYTSGDAADNSDDEAEEDFDIRFIYAKDGVEKSLSISDELPDEEDGWVFVRREETRSGKSDSDDIDQEQKEESRGDKSHATLRVWSEDGTEDVTEEVILKSGKQLILFMPDLKNVSIATTWQINSLYSWAKKNDIALIGIVAASSDEIANWKDLSMAAYPIYNAEDTEIKMVVRGNPAVVYLEDGEIVWKSSLLALDTEDFLSPEASGNAASYARNDRVILFNKSGIYLAVMAVLLLMSMRFQSIFRHPRLIKTHKEGGISGAPDYDEKTTENGAKE